MSDQTGRVGSGRLAVGGPAPQWWAGWNPAYLEASRFVGGCVAAGAVLGALTELIRPAWGRRHAGPRRPGHRHSGWDRAHGPGRR